MGGEGGYGILSLSNPTARLFLGVELEYLMKACSTDVFDYGPLHGACFISPAPLPLIAKQKHRAPGLLSAQRLLTAQPHRSLGGHTGICSLLRAFYQ